MKSKDLLKINVARTKVLEMEQDDLQITIKDETKMASSALEKEEGLEQRVACLEKDLKLCKDELNHTDGNTTSKGKAKAKTDQSVNALSRKVKEKSLLLNDMAKKYNNMELSVRQKLEGIERLQTSIQKESKKSDRNFAKDN